MTDLYPVGYGVSEETSLDILGGKGGNLMKMANEGVNVPPAVIIPTTYCQKVINKEVSVVDISVDVLCELESIKVMFGYMPLFSVRSGAKVSLPGMLNTILNVGLCNSNISEWEARIGVRATWDSYRRLIQMFGDVVFNIPSEKYEAILTAFRSGENVATDAELTTTALQVIAQRFLEITPNFPQSFKMQLRKAIEAVFKSWNNQRAITYRELNKVPHDIGTAVVVQSMVFGNFNDKSCTGVLFTRNPSTGEKAIYGEYLVNAQGEDVVAGIRTPLKLSSMLGWNSAVHKELIDTVLKLEANAKDVQDVEFTVQDGKLYILQTRNAKRTALAAVNVATDLVSEGVISKEDAFKRITYDQFCIAQKPIIDPKFSLTPTGSGIPASSGFATGVAAFSSAKAIELAKTQPVILLAKETTPEDIKGMNAAVGILTQTGGSSSHAAVVARGMDKVCVVGCLDLKPTTVDDSITAWSLNGVGITEGITSITIEGVTGKIWVNIDVPTIGAFHNTSVALLESWAKGISGALIKGTDSSSDYLLTHDLDTDFEALAAKVSGFKGIVSLDTIKDNLPEWDSHLLELVSPFDADAIKHNKLKALLETPVSGVTLDLDGVTVLQGTRLKLKSKGYELLDPILTLEDVIDAGGFVKLSKSVADSPKLSRLLELKKIAGDDINIILSSNSIVNKEKCGNIQAIVSKDEMLSQLFA